jgi:hypothetical protein
MKTFKFKTAFNLNLLLITFFVLNGLFFKITIFWIIAFVFLMLLPACSTKQ